MTTKKYAYEAYDELYTKRQFDESYEENSETQDRVFCDTIEDARAELKRMLSDISDPYTIERTRRGLDTIKYHMLGIERLYWDDAADDWEYDDTYEDMDAISTLPEDVEKKARESERSYHAFLDFERDDYHGIE